jgi:guanylate kinase
VSYEPKVGDIVLFPGKWPGQRYFGIVEEVTTRDKSQISTVDIQPLERLGRTNKYVIDVRKKSVWRRGDELTPCDPVEYDEQNKIWLLPMVPSSTKPNPVKQPSPAARDHSLKEYARLKRWLMQGTLTTAALGTSYYVIRNGVAEALAFAAGSAASLLYLTLLQRSVDRLRPAYLEIEEEVTEHASNEASERPPAAPAFPVVRYALPFLLILGLFLVQKGSLTPREVFACILGFLSYKIPLWYVSIREYIDAAREHSAGTKTSPLASGEADSHGLLRALPQKVYPVRNLPNLSKTPPPVEAIVVTGPSGVGKSTLIARLLAEFPDHLGYSVSTTTRAPRPGEVNGVSYHFVSKEKFLADVAAGKFIEHACVYGNYYGTTVDAVRAVTQASPPRICLLSLDLQGVQTMMSGQSLEAFFVWIAPPSLAELERRLRERETESPADLHRRLDAARQEMEFAEKSANFDVRIVNDDFEVAYNKLRRVVLALLHGRR